MLEPEALMSDFLINLVGEGRTIFNRLWLSGRDYGPKGDIGQILHLE